MIRKITELLLKQLEKEISRVSEKFCKKLNTSGGQRGDPVGQAGNGTPAQGGQAVRIGQFINFFTSNDKYCNILVD